MPDLEAIVAVENPEIVVRVVKQYFDGGISQDCSEPGSRTAVRVREDTWTR
jgi:hypothetical protein